MIEASSWWEVGAWFSAEEWQAIWSFATFTTAAVAAVLALRQLEQNAKSHADQVRPYIIVDFAAPQGGGAIFIEIVNSGLTTAIDIRLKWSDRPKVADAKAAQAMQRWVFDGPLLQLAPGRRIRYYLGPFPDDDKRTFRVDASYRGPDGRKWESPSILNFDQWAPAEVDRDPIQEIASTAKRTRAELEKLRKAVELASIRLEVVADHFSETTEFKRATSQKRIRRYEQGARMERALARRSAMKE